MPYCSIEEAWGENLHTEINDIDVDIIEKEENYSRNYNRLKEHSGVKTRLPKKKKKKTKKNKKN